MNDLAYKLCGVIRGVKYNLDKELRGEEVTPQEWEKCYAACSDAIGAYEEDAVRQEKAKAEEEREEVAHARRRR